MVGSNHRKLIAIYFAVVFALGFATYVLWPPAQGVDDTLFRQDPLLPAGESQATEPGLSESNPGKPRTTLLSAQPRGNLQAADKRKRAATQMTFPHGVVMQDYKNDLWEEIQANPPAFSWPGDPALDADMAYRLYMYYGNCSVLSSRGDHIDQQIDKIASRAEKAGGRSLISKPPHGSGCPVPWREGTRRPTWPSPRPCLKG